MRGGCCVGVKVRNSFQTDLPVLWIEGCRELKETAADADPDRWKERLRYIFVK